MQNKFKKGESTFNCESCGRLTRHTGVQSIGVQECPQCYELAGIENDVLDGHATAGEVTREVHALVGEIIGKGGNEPDISFLEQ